MSEIDANDRAARPTFWAAGWNLSGYLPETAPYVTDDWYAAREYLVDALDRVVDSYSAADFAAETDETGLEALAEAKAATEGPFYAAVGYVAYWIDQIAAQDVDVCAECGTVHDPDEYGCWVCGHKQTVTAAEYYIA